MAIQSPTKEWYQPKVESSVTRTIIYCHKRINDLVYHVQLEPKQKPKVVHRSKLWVYSGRHPPTWHLCQNKQDPLKAVSREQSPETEAEDGDREEEQIIKETAATSFRSGRPRNAPTRYDPSSQGVVHC